MDNIDGISASWSYYGLIFGIPSGLEFEYLEVGVWQRSSQGDRIMESTAWRLVPNVTLKTDLLLKVFP